MKKRILSALGLLLVMGLCVFLSPVSRLLFFTAAGILCAIELSRNMEKLSVYCALWVMIAYLVAHCILLLLNAGIAAYCVAFLGAVYLALFTGILRERQRGSGAVNTMAWLAYPCLPFALIMYISQSEHWLETLILSCVPVWICDSMALFGGRRFGRHKAAPSISPNKTVEGVICGFLGAAASGFAIYGVLLLLQLRSLPLWVCVLVAAVSSTLGQIGDLSESLIKRWIGVKDFSDLIPGHGGMMDRADSLLFAIPTAYVLLSILLPAL